ncbi:hypothetical protein phiCbK_249 [Caulobacter phage phiCbK]|uniref:Uncharacterized protein n=2 Tax=Shapirovirus cbk TaxID=1204537 RepID=J3SMP2_9CAUD|nr:hypothetical protein phiCbK_249 [Caulobacter phage phiCbK]ARB14989.1 hypothetical protein Ccr32_gp070 [Caulobacter phage Ccr32]
MKRPLCQDSRHFWAIATKRKPPDQGPGVDFDRTPGTRLAHYWCECGATKA